MKGVIWSYNYIKVTNKTKKISAFQNILRSIHKNCTNKIKQKLKIYLENIWIWQN